MTGKGLLTVSQDSSSLHRRILSSWPYSYSIRAPLTEINKFKREKNSRRLTFCFLSDHTGIITNKVPFCTKAERPPYTQANPIHTNFNSWSSIHLYSNSKPIEETKDFVNQVIRFCLNHFPDEQKVSLLVNYVCSPPKFKRRILAGLNLKGCISFFGVIFPYIKFIKILLMKEKTDMMIKLSGATAGSKIQAIFCTEET